MNQSNNLYTSSWYNQMRENKIKSREYLISIILSQFKPKSIVDFGCGDGTWLAGFKKEGIYDILGIDGEWIQDSELQIQMNEIKLADLNFPVYLDRKFDLAISFEVAEHLFKDSAETFIQSITRHSDIVIFSAAIPLQSGVNHINEQWQSYWAEIFRSNEFIPVDFIRPLVWDNEDITYIYKQNIICYINKEKLKEYQDLTEFIEEREFFLNRVHPEKYIKESVRSNLYKLILSNQPGGLSLRRTIRYLFTALWATIRRRF